MKIALYHGFYNIHFEMLGYFLEYSKYSNITINIYAIDYNKDGTEWKEYYNKLFNMDFIWYNPINFNPNNYDIIILLTDDDKSFKDEWIDLFGKDKIICIDHCGLIRRPNIINRIATRFFARRPNCPWALPCYYGISKYEKQILLNNSNKIKIICIGIQNRPISIDFLKKIFENYENYEFHIIARFFDNKFENISNIFIYELCSVNIMFDLIKNSHYILCFDNPNNAFPIADSISGAIPIAFSYGCQLIIPDIWQQFYNFKSCITYNINESNNIKLSNNYNLDLIYNELYELILHRNIIFDKYFYDSEFRPLYTLEAKLIEKLNYPIPHILCNINYNIDSTNYSDFREIHNIIDLSNDTINNLFDNLYTENNNYIYYHKTFNIINNISDAIVFNINNLINEIIFFEIINKRKYKDVIILNKNSNYLNYYKRHFITYIYDSKIIILPQR